MQREFRHNQVQVRADGAGRIIHGYAVRFGIVSQDLGGWFEKIAAGAFRACLDRRDDIKFLHQHCDANLLARRGNGSLSVWEDSVGLAFQCSLPDTTVGRDVFELVRTGTLSEMSFGFQCLLDAWATEQDVDSNPIMVRTVRTADLLELSSVCWAAYGSAGTEITADVVARAAERPSSMPVELRSRIEAAPISAEEAGLRRRARLALLLAELAL